MIRRMALSAIAILALAYAGESKAVVINFDLSSGTLTPGLPDTYESGDIPFSPQTTTDTLEVWIEFADMFHMRFTDFPPGSNGAEELVEVSFSGPGDASLTVTDTYSIDARITFEPTMLMGEYLQPIPDTNSLSCVVTSTSTGCTSFNWGDFTGLPGLTTGGEVLFHDVHFDLTFTNFNGLSDITLDQVAFVFSGNDIFLEPWGVPEPSTLALFGFGLAGLAVMGRRRRKADAA